MNPPAVSTFIKTRRLELGLTLREAARSTGIPSSRLHDLEQGRSSSTGKPTAPTRANIEAIARAYKEPVDYILDLIGRPNLDPAAPDERALISRFRGLDAGHQGVVLQLVDQLYRLEHPS
jgi:transcriptional regulator with XRE-family HTH domain